MKLEDWAVIRHLHVAEGLTVSEIARRFSLDRKTVRQAVQKDHFLDKEKRKKASLLDPYVADIEELLKAHPGISGVRILEEIREKGYPGKITILRDYLQKVGCRRKEPYLRLEVPAGLQAQADWAHCGQFPVGSTYRQLYCFLLVLSYSRALHLEFTFSMTHEAFLEAHVKAFRFFEGCPKEILYDNLSSVVLSRFGSSIRLNPWIVDFAEFYGFMPRACNPGKAREKGRVEMGVKYVKRNFLSGRTFQSIDDLRDQALRWRDEVANQRVHAETGKRPADLLKEERPILLPLPESDYDTALRLPFICPQDGFLTFETNSYSVPFTCVGKDLLMKIDTRSVKIFQELKMVAEHKRSFDRHRRIEDPAHRKELVSFRKESSFSKAFEELSNLSAECKRHLEGLNRCEVRVQHHVMRLLGLSRVYGETELRQAVSQALSFEAFGADYIENIIVQNRRRRSGRIPTGPVQLPSRPELVLLNVNPHSLETYETDKEDPTDAPDCEPEKGEPS